MPEPRARFITLEGGEGAGKTTQSRLLAAALSAAGIPVLRTREPGGAPGAERIRALLLGGTGFDPLAEAMLHFAARREHVQRLIRPALDAGITVICDRFTDSTLAYQGAGQGLGHDSLHRLNALALEGFAPDLTFILDLPPEFGMARAKQRSEPDRYERLGEAFHARVRAGFLATASANRTRCVLIDAARPIDDVFADIWKKAAAQ